MAPRVLLFGAPSIEQDGAALLLPLERRSQLLLVLAHRRGWVARNELAALLWPDHEHKLAVANLRKTLFRLQDWPWGAALELQTGSVRFFADSDVAAFEAALQAGRIEAALALRRGEFLLGFDDDANEAWTDWLRFERDRLRAAWRAAALEHLGSAGLAPDNLGSGGLAPENLGSAALTPARGIELSARLLEADPLDEAALQAHMALLARSGQSARARQAWRDYTKRLADELGLAPGAALQALHDGLGAAVPMARPAAAAPEIIGRAVERRRLAELLARDDVRLLCLTGPGGVGKTRLARCVLHDLAAAHGNDAAFVPLEDVTSIQDVATRIARELGLALQGRSPPLEQLAQALRERATLLVLDNFEQLVAEAPHLATLLQACPQLKLLVTSRTRLGLASEQLFALEGLPCPEPEDSDRLEAFDAARLFIAAAQRVEPALVAATEAAAIVDICRQLDGLPLALELAAAWTRVLSCEAIAAELRAGTELLRAADAAHPPRHASMEVVFEQSWQRLVAAERDALARLSVFRGGFTAESARAVAGAALPVLSALADKSLLRRDGARLALHPLVQQLAAPRLRAEDAAPVRAAHAAYFHRRLAQLKDASAGGDRAALQLLDAEFENCRLAWQFAIDQGQGDALRRSAPTLFEFVDHRARFEDGLALSRQVLDAPLAAADPALQALVQAQAAWLHSRLGRYEQAQADAAQALATARAQRARDAEFQALSVLGSCTWFTGRLAEAKQHFSQALRLARAAAMAHESATVFENLSLVEKHLGDYDAALAHAVEALAQHRRNGDMAAVALCLSNLGSTTLFMDDTDAAARYLAEALALSEQHGLVSTRVYALANLTELAMKTGDRAAATAHAQRAVEVADATGMRSLAGWLKVQLARLAALRGELDSARALLSTGTALAIELNARSVQAIALQGLAELLEAQGHAAGARQVLAFAADEATLGAHDRDELRVEWARRVGGRALSDPPWPPNLALPQLLQRIVAEAGRGHAPLIALLDAPR